MKKSWIRTTCTKRTRNRSIVEAFRDSIRITNARNNETNEIIPSLPRLWEFVDDAEKKSEKNTSSCLFVFNGRLFSLSLKDNSRLLIFRQK